MGYHLTAPGLPEISWIAAQRRVHVHAVKQGGFEVVAIGTPITVVSQAHAVFEDVLKDSVSRGSYGLFTLLGKGCPANNQYDNRQQD